METTFITIHDLSPDARTLYASDSIIDILGYSPDEVVHRSCWDFFHPDELPVAKAKHGRGVELDKASVLSYCRMKGKDGRWLGCEVVFTVVYDVLVSCTSIYRRGLKSQSRAIEAPAVRRLFSSSPRDPRYHMLSHLSSKFTAPAFKSSYHEPRAALFLNRYTRTLTIMYATDGLKDVLGISGEELRGKSFYYCIQENCLSDSVRCLENAKANDSIAYLRFWFRNPGHEEEPSRGNSRPTMDDEDTPMTDASSAEEESHYYDRRRNLNEQSGSSGNSGRERSTASSESQAVSSTDSMSPVARSAAHNRLTVPENDSRTSSGDSDNSWSHEAVFGDPPQHRLSSLSSVSDSLPNHAQQRSNQRGPSNRREAIELEAVVSCTSDGMVVCLRRAVPFAPLQQQTAVQTYANGLFAVPWAIDPILPTPQQRLHFPQQSSFAPSLAPAQAFHRPLTHSSNPSPGDFMNTIRDIAVFAWAVVGINGSLADYGRGKPRGESQPSSGLPIWQPDGLTDTISNSPSFASGSSPQCISPTNPTLAVSPTPSSNDSLNAPVADNTHLGPRYRSESDSNQSRSSATPSHLVDGFSGAFHDPAKTKSGDGSHAIMGGRNSGFGFGDPGLSVNATYASKLYNNSAYASGTPVSTATTEDRPRPAHEPRGDDISSTAGSQRGLEDSGMTDGVPAKRLTFLDID